ncbi:hypothetical protein ACLOJK_006913, partial [Asimina triloba]
TNGQSLTKRLEEKERERERDREREREIVERRPHDHPFKENSLFFTLQSTPL